MKRLPYLYCLCFMLSLVSTSAMAQKNNQSRSSKNTQKEYQFNPVRSKDNVILVTDGCAATEDEAVKIALRSAIEQTYGTFVSADTQILNDDLVKDEIVTVSTGNINGYKILSSAKLPDGMTAVSVQASVSATKLTSYAQSKDARTELSGATFAANIKLMELNAENERIAFSHQKDMFDKLLPSFFDIELNTSEPRYANGGARMSCSVNFKLSETARNYGKNLISFLSALSLNQSDLNLYQESSFPFHKFKLSLPDTGRGSVFSIFSSDSSGEKVFYLRTEELSAFFGYMYECCRTKVLENRTIVLETTEGAKYPFLDFYSVDGLISGGPEFVFPEMEKLLYKGMTPTIDLLFSLSQSDLGKTTGIKLISVQDYKDQYKVAYIDENGIDHGEGVFIGGSIWAPVNCGSSPQNPYGKTYKYEEKDSVCPQGWRLPKKEEFDRLWGRYANARGYSKNNAISLGEESRKNGEGWKNVIITSDESTGEALTLPSVYKKNRNSEGFYYWCDPGYVWLTNTYLEYTEWNLQKWDCESEILPVRCVKE